MFSILTLEFKDSVSFSNKVLNIGGISTLYEHHENVHGVTYDYSPNSTRTQSRGQDTVLTR